MRYQPLPQTDLTPSALALGTVPFGTSVDAGTAFQFLDAFFEQGGNLIDTAHIYGAWAPGGLGLSEGVIGQWLNERHVRDQVIISSKGAHPLLSSMDVPRLSPLEIVADIEESLRCLQTETIDLYWLHRDDLSLPVAVPLDTLQEQVRKGTIRYFGCSNWRLLRIEEAWSYATDHGIAGFVGNQLMWSYAVPNVDGLEDQSMVAMDAPTYDFHRSTSLPIMAYSSQAHGYFSKASANPADIPEHLQKVYGSAENTRRLHRLQAVAEELSLPLSVVALAYLSSQPIPTYPIFGCASLHQLRENMEAGDVLLSAETLQYLETGELQME
jgi:aryl-alcohol dehydrogenase-like predicted oxidoreductase